MVGELPVKATILIADDDPIILSSVGQALQASHYRVLIADNGGRAWHVLNDQHVDMVLLDIDMPVKSGLDICRDMKQVEELAKIPVIILTVSKDQVIEAFGVGAVDYIIKPHNQVELLSRVRTHTELALLRTELEKTNRDLALFNAALEKQVEIRTMELVSVNSQLKLEIEQREILQRKLDYQNQFDPITQIHNRQSLVKFLDEFFKSKDLMPRSGEGHYIYYLDLDQFNIINNSCGYRAGNDFLRGIGSELRNIKHSLDYLGRIHGDHFIIVSQADGEDSATNFAKVIQRCVEQYAFQWQDNNFKLNVSIGVVEVGSEFENAEHLLNVAENACRESKGRGGGEIVFYSHAKEVIKQNQAKLQWVPVIQHAIEHDDFVLMGQHITELSSMDNCKLEVLIRLKSTKGGVIPPGHFIPVAEKYHLIALLDKWVIEHVFKALSLVQVDSMLSINLSGESIIKDGFAEHIIQRMEHYKILPRNICFEITETSALSDINKTSAFIDLLHSYGFKFALDDFGQGTSSYAYLKALKLDFIKIDGMFVQNLEVDEVSRSIVSSIVSLASTLDVKVVAECVESLSVLNVLRSLGVDYVQGFHTHKPEPLVNLLP